MEDFKEEEVRDLTNPTTPRKEVEVAEVTEVDPGEDKDLTEAPQRGIPEKTPRQKMLTEIDAGIAEKLDIG